MTKWGIGKRLPRTREKLPGATGRSPGTTEKSPGTTEKSPGTTEKSPGTTEKSSGTTEKSPGTTEKSPGTTEKSPGTTEKSSGTTEKSPGTDQETLIMYQLQSERQTIQHLQREVRQQTEEKEKVEKVLLDKEKEIEGMEETIDEQKAENRKLTNKLAGLEAEHKLAQHQEDQQKAMVRSLEREVSRLTQENESAQKVLLEHNKKTEEVTVANRDLTTEKTKVADRLTGLEVKYEIARHQIDEKEDMVRSLQKEVTRLTREQETAQKVIMDNKKTIEDLTGVNKGMAETIEDKQLTEKTKLTDRLAGLDAEHERAQHQVELQEDMVRSLQMEVNRLTKEKETAQKVLTDKENEIVDLARANKGMEETIDKLFAENTKLTNKLAMMEQEEKLKVDKEEATGFSQKETERKQGKATEDSMGANKGIEETIEEQLAEKTKVADRLARVEAKHEIAQRQAEWQKDMVRSLQREVSRLKKEIETAQKILLDNKKEIEDLTGANKGMEDTIDELLGEKTKLTNRMASLDAEHERAKHQIDLQKDMVRSLQMQSEVTQLTENLDISENKDSLSPLLVATFRNEISRYYALQVCKQQPVAYDEEFILDVDDTFTTMDILQYNVRRQAFDRQPLESIADIFNPGPNRALASPVRILIWGVPGIGKTTLIAKILTHWNKQDVGVLKRYDLVFAIALRKVERTQSIVDCIFDQLPVSDVHMKEVLEDYLRRSSRVLIILDGYDELGWQPDEDHDIMKLLTGRLFPHASVLVTTRKTCTSDIIEKMKPDTRVEILGFSPDNAKSFIMKYFGRQPSEGEALLKKIGPTLLSTGIFSVPMLLLQVCLLWEDDQDVILSDKICLLYNQVVTCLVRRYGAKDKNPVRVEDMHALMHALEKLAFECLLKENGVTVFNQEDVKRYCGEQFMILVQLGLLREQKNPSRTNPVAQYSFSHKTMQEYFAAQYLSERLTIEEATKHEILRQYCPTARKVQTLGELLILTCGRLGRKAKFILDHLRDIHNTPDVQLVEEEFYNFFVTGKSKKDWNKDIKLEDFASAEDLTHQFIGQWNDYPPVLLTYQSYMELYLLCCHESGLTAQFAEQVFLRDTIQFSGARPRVYSVLSHMIAEASEKIKGIEHLRLVNMQNYFLGSTLEELHKLSGLKELNLRQSRLGRHLPTCTIPRRLELRFKYRRIMKTSEDDLAKAPALLARQLPHLRSLKKLVIAWNDLGPEDMKQLLPAIKELTNLEQLFLSGNDLGGLGKNVTDLVAFLPKLKVFEVYFCQLTFTEIQMIASSLTENCPDLELFDFQLNPIQPGESIWVGEREMDTVKATLSDKVFVPLYGSIKLPPAF
ncbi:uncharacterized protein LOC118406047 [Branchiostoma floridae]|uniref:Uncharacterized protein LOC118406047 n=1 Tax=Branchiostoma floridae TaxID=7739 RepID=A0A9J7HLG8_BRAFL|nr:uncharacterized protein LOC118406047 [Branchiostoma floridae]